jgi:hypothetical protein
MERWGCAAGVLFSLASHGAAGEMGKVSPYHENLATPGQGASISSPTKVRQGFDLRSIIDPGRFPGPEKHGSVILADVDQREVFTIDLGRIRRSGLAVIRTRPGDGPVHGDPDGRLPKQMRIEVSAGGPDGTWTLLRQWKPPHAVPRRQSIVWDDAPVRYLRFDLGRNADRVGSRMASVEVFRRYKLPSLADRLRDLDRLLRPDVAALKPFRTALAAGESGAAVKALRAHFANASMELASGVAKHGRAAEQWKRRTVSYGDRSWQQPGEKFDWYFFPCDLSHEPPSYWVAASQFWYLPDYYNGTGRKAPKYARLAAEMIRDWLADVPCPRVHRVEGVGGWFMVTGWPAIRVANRAGGLARAVKAFAPAREHFDDETWAHVLYAVWEHAQFLAHVLPELGGNWSTWANERLILTAGSFPEFRDRRAWLAAGRKAFEKVVLEQVSPDGKECEDSTYYCLRAMREIINMYTTFEAAGVKLSPEVSRRVRRALDFAAWLHQPGFRNPGIGDMGLVHGPRQHLPLVHDYAAAWGRDDLLYIDSRGKRGKRPEQCSRAFRADGWLVMRSDWDDGLDARHLIFRAPPAGCRGHGHLDVLGITLYAFGRPLLIDPGMTIYGTKGSGQYVETQMHNVVTVDGASQAHGPGKVSAWESTADYDLAEAEHSLYRGVTHRRRVLFVKPDYFVLVDVLAGKGKRTLDWNYQFLRGAAPREAGGTVRTHFPDGGNLAIVPVSRDRAIELRARPFQYVVAGGEAAREVASTGWQVRLRGELPERLVTVLFPLKGSRIPDPLTARWAQPNVLTVRHGQRTDVIAWRPAGTAGPWTFHHAGAKRTVSGEACVFRRRGTTGKPSAAGSD